ncbi:NAD(P)-dependent oxidoreductase [Pyxidicoccus fallax]|uniref:NAD(P)-dependent oxidoreductase n=1 Tax=Pyxidicoccus fallax TaxID=394095 RepID=A0A848L926_9BACT|nr:NAD(P)-dependent oxidoreductase [Pyxidicoccus fallax]NMO13355.1 NAD(P)-dependent oxidoreductase [Pyxidicoccus fallax]NPC83479.1 NAD(P)-dependent oxidoreductase [Pyxidicoccus fallax]
MKLGFIGLGNMGLPMAKNLLAAGHEVTVWNRSPAKAEPLREKGARVAGTPAEAARGAEVVFTMLADDRAVEAAVFGSDGLHAGLGKGAVHVSSSTISVALSERLTQAHASAGQGYVSAPVFGRPDAADAKQLWVVAAGAKADVERSRPLLEAVGRGLTVLGEKASAANVVKLSGNFLIASMMEALGEAFALTRKSGVEAKVFMEVFQSVFARGPIFERYAQLIADEKYSPAGFPMRLGLKDVGLVLEAARGAQVPMPLGSLLHDQYLGGVAQGHGDLDWSALGALVAERAGLKRGS